jgi:hypothetical protein
MRNALFLVPLLALLAPLPALAQMRGGDPQGAVPLPQDIRPRHTPLPAYFEADQCGKAGCLIVINKAAAYDVTQFYINDGQRDGNVVVWGANQFQGIYLRPNRALWTPRPDKMKCALMVRVVLRNRDTKEEAETIQPFNLCQMPKRGFAVLQIRYAEAGNVILEPGQVAP